MSTSFFCVDVGSPRSRFWNPHTRCRVCGCDPSLPTTGPAPPSRTTRASSRFTRPPRPRPRYLERRRDQRGRPKAPKAATPKPRLLRRSGPRARQGRPRPVGRQSAIRRPAARVLRVGGHEPVPRVAERIRHDEPCPQHRLGLVPRLVRRLRRAHEREPHQRGHPDRARSPHRRRRRPRERRQHALHVPLPAGRVDRSGRERLLRRLLRLPQHDDARQRHARTTASSPTKAEAAPTAAERPDTVQQPDERTFSSHEFLESITDPGVGLAIGNAAPLAWYDRIERRGCGRHLRRAGSGRRAGNTAMQKSWSNKYGRVPRGGAGDGCGCGERRGCGRGRSMREGARRCGEWRRCRGGRAPMRRGRRCGGGSCSHAPVHGGGEACEGLRSLCDADLRGGLKNTLRQDEVGSRDLKVDEVIRSCGGSCRCSGVGLGRVLTAPCVS